MLKFQLDTPADLKEAAIIAKRRQYEEERKKRIFNPRNRVLGVDMEGIKQQIEEKEQLRREQEEKERRFREEAIQIDRIMTQREKEIAEERRRIERDINDYRTIFQKYEDRREFDLNDPNYVVKSRPARSSDSDICLGISSAQKFEGEDLMDRERKQAQMKQQREWWSQQIAERRQAELDRQRADKMLSEALTVRDGRALELDYANREYRRKLDEATADFNARLAAEQAFKRAEQNRMEDEDNLAEQYNNLSSDMLRETNNHESNFGPRHKIVTAYRGMTDDELEKLREEKDRQLAEQERLRREKEEEEKRWQDMTNAMTRQLTLQERELERQQRALNVDISEDNARLAGEQKTKIEYMDKVVFTNPPTEKYFDQFNTTSR